ncbi:MAG: response regulator [Bacteroidales bacterium]|nr:response regulator [Bacteroidales bacterium]
MNKDKTILVVDDSETNLILLDAILSEEFNVITAFNAKQAYTVLINNKLDLILLDLLMPNENGFEIIKNLQNSIKYKQIPIIVVTAFANEGNKQKANEYGVLDVIEKPIDIPVFLDKIVSVLNLE